MKNFIDEKFFALIDEFKNKSENEIFEHIVSTFFSRVPIPTQESLQNYFKTYPYWGELDRLHGNFDVFKKKAHVFKHHHRDFVWLYNKLNDYKSKYVLFSVLNNFYNFDFVNLSKATERVFKHYFDLDLYSCENEVFVDVGAFTGDSVEDFVSSFGEKSYKKIYCYEITTSMMPTLKQNLAKYKNIIFKNSAVADKSGVMFLQENDFSSSANQAAKKGSEKIEKIALDDDIDEKISMIKMDIEGGERKALIGAKKHIIEDVPKFFISVYHNNSDLFKLPKLIYSYTKKYDFYLRYYGGNLYATEIVLICRPKKFNIY